MLFTGTFAVPAFAFEEMQAGVSADTVFNDPENTAHSEKSDSTEETVTPGDSEIRGNRELTDDSGIAEESVAPDNPMTPEEPAIPENSVTPDDSVIPENPVIPEEPATPENSITPENPDNSEEPACPDDISDTPEEEDPQQEFQDNFPEETIEDGQKIPLKDAVLKYSSLKYTGKARTQNSCVTVTAAGGPKSVLVPNKDYRISYRNNINAGTATMIISGKGKYTGTLQRTFSITPVPVKRVTLKYSSLSYRGQERTQTASTVVEARVGGKRTVLKRGRDYRITYQNNLNAGKAVLIVKGTGNFQGTIKKKFTITRVPLNSAEIQYQSMKYTGKARTQTRTTKVYAVVHGKRTLLKKGTDYTVTYRNNYYGTARMYIKGRGNFKGTIKKTFKITASWEKYKTSTGSPRAAEFSRLCGNAPINTSDGTYTIFPEFTSMIVGSDVIPGIRRTHVIDWNGTHSSCKDMVVQGLCTAGKYTLISAYCHEKEHSSVIYVLKDGKYAETVVLMRPDGGPLINHTGGLAYLNKTVYIAGSIDNCVYSIPLSEITSHIGKGDAVKLYARWAFGTYRRASLISAYNGRLYVGTFYMDEYRQATDLSTLQAYDPLTGSAVGDEKTLPTNTAQGVAFVEKDGQLWLIVSSSYGRANTSELMSVPWGYDQRLYAYKKVAIPNMSEEIALSGGKLLISFESAAKTYTSNGFYEYIRPIDRLISVDYSGLLP